MWALRRAAIPLRCQSYRVVARTICIEKDVLIKNIEHEYTRENKVPRGYILCSHESSSFTTSIWSGNFASISGAESSGSEGDLEDGSFNLDKNTKTNGNKDVDISEEEVDETVDNAFALSGTEMKSNDWKGGRETMNSPPLFEMLMTTSRQSINASLDQWVKEGKPLGKSELDTTMLNLRRRKIYGKALQLIEWLEETKHLDFTDREYASHVDLIAKIHGIQKAEKYTEQIPEHFKGEYLYRTLLANYVVTGNINKSEEIFDKIRELGPLTSFSCNQLLILYKRSNCKRITDVLKIMEKEGLKPTHFTYRILIEIKGRANDIQGMEDLIQTMKAEGLDPGLGHKSKIARYYILAKQNEKAEAILKEIEGDNINENRYAIKEILPLYAALGKADDVARIWKVCESNPHLEDCSAAIQAWGKLGKIENAEEVFEHMIKTWNKLSPRFYNNLLKVYADHKLFSKGKDLAKRMGEDGCVIGPLTWDVLVKLYVEEGEVEKADSILDKAVQNSTRPNSRPFFSSYMVILDNYAKRGDVHNAEKIFNKLRQNGYAGRSKLYESLLDAYINANMPVYGFRERMKVDNIFPNRVLAGQLAVVDGFVKTWISNLVD